MSTRLEDAARARDEYRMMAADQVGKSSVWDNLECPVCDAKIVVTFHIDKMSLELGHPVFVEVISGSRWLPFDHDYTRDEVLGAVGQLGELIHGRPTILSNEPAKLV